MERLLGPGGCPWDRAQTLESLRPHLIEEAYELDEALADGGSAAIVEEIGDVLMQVLLLSAKVEGRFAATLQQVVDGLASKLVRRHPHVFAGQDAQSVEDAEAQWHAAKAKERKAQSTPLAGLPKGLPALTYAVRLIEKAAAHKILPQGSEPLRDAAALGSALEALTTTLASAEATAGASRDEARSEAIAALFGTLLFEVVKLASAWDVNAEHALRATVRAKQTQWVAPNAPPLASRSPAAQQTPQCGEAARGTPKGTPA